MKNITDWSSSPLRLAAVAPVILATFIFSHCSDAAEPAEKVTPLMTRDLAGVPGKEALMLTVEYLPGGASLPHRHDANVFVYILEGALTMQVQGGAPVKLTPGQSFYESPTDIHMLSANASKTATAKILVFMVKDKGKPASRPVPQREDR